MKVWMCMLAAATLGVLDITHALAQDVGDDLLAFELRSDTRSTRTRMRVNVPSDKPGVSEMQKCMRYVAGIQIHESATELVTENTCVGITAEVRRVGSKWVQVSIRDRKLLEMKQVKAHGTLIDVPKTSDVSINSSFAIPDVGEKVQVLPEWHLVRIR